MSKNPYTITVANDNPYFFAGWAFVHEHKGEFQAMHHPANCRSNMVDFLYHTTKDNTYDGNSDIYIDTLPDSDYTKIGYIKAAYNKETVTANLPLLHKIEEDLGIKKTEAIFISGEDDGPNYYGVVFIGDKVWQSNLWKQSLYTYFLQCLTKIGFLTAGKYKSFLTKKNKAILLSKVTTEFEEVYGEGFQAIHNNSGFVAICCSLDGKKGHYDESNARMAAILTDKVLVSEEA